MADKFGFFLFFFNETLRRRVAENPVRDRDAKKVLFLDFTVDDRTANNSHRGPTGNNNV